MNRSIAVTFLALTGFVAHSEARPSDSHASKEAREVLRYLSRISGKATIMGQHNYPQENARTEWMTKTKDLTGYTPGLWGSDFGWDESCMNARPGLLQEAINQWKAGSLVSLSWHCVRPMDVDGKGGWKESVQAWLNDQEWKETVTAGTPLNKRWIAQIDAMAVKLKVLRDAKVPVLWRPFHEMNGGWFWWGGRPGKTGAAALWRMMYDRYVKVHRLDNLIWVWSPGAPDGKWAKAVKDFYPGHAYVDVLAMDVYNADFKQRYYDEYLDLAQGKPIAFGEVGELPSPEVLKAQPQWAWFLVWAEHLVTDSKPEAIKATYSLPRVISRKEVRDRTLSKP